VLALEYRAATGAELSVGDMEAFVAQPDLSGPVYAVVDLRCVVGYPLPGLDDPGQTDPCDTLDAACVWAPEALATVPPAGDEDLVWPDHPLTVGLVRVTGCGQGPR
jgi:hypothetical protein